MPFRSLILLVFALHGLKASAQLEEVDENALQAYADHRYQTSLRGAHALTTWSVLSLGTGIYGSLTQDGSDMYFHQMNAFWGGIDLIIAGASYASLKRDKNQPLLLPMAQMDQKKVERIYLLNAGLDVLYVTGGYLLIDHSSGNVNNEDRLKGYGTSIMLQGSFLLAFDSVMYLLHRKNGRKRLHPLLENLSFNGQSIRYTFP